MDGDPVREGLPDDAEAGSDEEDEPVTPISLAEMFMNICPAYMAMGMTWNQFWHCNTKVHRAYRLAWEQRKQYRNWEMWWQGSYIYEALVKVAPVMRAALGKGRVEPGKYSEEPYPLSAREAEARRQIQQKQRMERMLEMFRHESAENLRKKKAEEATATVTTGGPHPSQPAAVPPSPTGEGIEDSGKLEAKGD